MTNNFVQIKTTHSAEIQWMWTDARQRDVDYHFDVNDNVDAKVKEYMVRDDRNYCCQCEGRLLYGDNLANITAAATELAEYLSTFDGIRFIKN